MITTPTKSLLILLIGFTLGPALSSSDGLCIGSTLSAQATIDENRLVPTKDANKIKKKKSLWKTLSKITYKKKMDEVMGFKIDVPVFSDKIKKLDGKKVTVKGYIIPVEGYKSHKEFILSAFPYNMCFFCGGAGPETVMEVIAVEGVEYSAEQVLLTGILQLNSEDPASLMYLLKDAVLVED